MNFCDATAAYCTDIHLLGTAQLTASGTAVLKFIPGIGSHSYKAVFLGTNLDAASSSSEQPLTVTAQKTVASTTTIAASGSVGNYTLTATVQGNNTAPPTGTVSFLDTSNANAVLGTADLEMGSTAVSALGFLNSSTPATLPWPQAVAVADFNGDGKLDLVVPVYSIFAPTSDASVLLGNGDGTFTAGPEVPASGQNANNAAVADFNSDGIADIALSLPDADQVQVLMGKGDGSFSALPPITIAGSYVYSVATGDLNGDGKPDLIAASCATASVFILLGNGDGTFTQRSNPGVGGCPSSVAVCDFNGDGIPDLAVALNTGATGVPSTVTILIGNGDGTFTQKPESPATGDNPIFIVTGDFNGDGILDLAVANTYVDTNEPGTITVLLGNGDGTFTPAAESPVVRFLPYSVVVGDFNGDGKADLAASNAGSDTVTVLLGKGDGTFTVAASPQVGATPNVAAAGDFNGDGLSDLAAANNDALSVSILLAQMTATSTATATATGISPVGAGTHLVDASYPGDSNFGASVSGTVPLTGVVPPGFTITGTAVTVAAGATTGNTSTVTVTPAGGFTGSVTLTAAVTSSPNGAVVPPTFSFGSTSPVTITGASAATATLTIATTAESSGCSALDRQPGAPWYAGGGAVLACVLLFGIPARRRRWRAMLGVALLAVLALGFEACGTPHTIACPAIARAGTTPGDYTVTVTGTSGAISATGTVALTVQ
ncbi:MAG: VCBS repeat-containing protein [Terracidiphilus sp.]